jgi:NADH dehydrogenase
MDTNRTRPRVVIIGAGFGGLSAARALRKAPVDVTVIDRRNYHLFQPLLYQVATAGLSPADIASPIRAILRDQRNTSVLLARVEAVDRAARCVIADGCTVPFDYLVVASGARHAYFGHEEWEPVAPGLKKIEDATDIRRNILLAFEKAETEPDPAERARLLTLVVIGAGPTGVEMAGAIAELARRALAADFRAIDPAQARVILIEAGPRILPSFPESLSTAATRSLHRLGVEIRLGAAVTGCDTDGVTVGDTHVPTRTIVWAAGVMASPAARWLSTDKDRAGRVPVGPDLALPDDPHIFVIGDTAAATGADGRMLPGVAPVAKQQGAYVARVIMARSGGRAPPPRFRYRSYGNLATVGRRAAVADFGFLRVTGSLAWLLWGVVHVFFLIGFRNRLAVLIQWLWAYLTFESGSRLITGSMD